MSGMKSLAQRPTPTQAPRQIISTLATTGSMLPENQSWQWALGARLPSTITSILQNADPERAKEQKLCVFQLHIITPDEERVNEQKLVSKFTLQQDRESKLSLCPGRQSMESKSHSPTTPDFPVSDSGANPFSFLLSIFFVTKNILGGGGCPREDQVFALFVSWIPPLDSR